MREIQFRAWHKKGEVMLLEDNLGDVFRWFNEGQPVEIMQYTGLKDKNGKEIYEGDILIPITMYDKRADSIQEIKWDINCFTVPRMSWLYIVGGNIYENPELLEAK